MSDDEVSVDEISVDEISVAGRSVRPGKERMVENMLMDIFVGIMCVAAAGAGIWVWWVENGGHTEK